MNKLSEQIQQWVDADNELKLLNEKTSALRERKNMLCKNLMTYAENNKMVDKFIPISDGKLKFCMTNVAQPLSYKFMEKSLGEIIKNEVQVRQIIEHLKQKREIKKVAEIKRFTNT